GGRAPDRGAGVLPAPPGLGGQPDPREGPAGQGQLTCSSPRERAPMPAKVPLWPRGCPVAVRVHLWSRSARSATISTPSRARGGGWARRAVGRDGVAD